LDIVLDDIVPDCNSILSANGRRPVATTGRCGHLRGVIFQSGTAPIFHLSFPVRDLQEALVFYSALGGVVGHREAGWADVALFGARVTIQQIPEDVLQPMPRSRHFGATLAWPDWESLVSRPSGFVEGRGSITWAPIASRRRR